MKKIGILILFSVVSGGLLFYFRINNGDVNMSPINLAERSRAANDSQRQAVLKNMPDPKFFDHFVYEGEDSMKVDVDCKDGFTAILIYQVSSDYRYDPLGSKFNTAYDCDGRGKMKIEISLKSANLENGLKYYLIKAHQGASGGWYDPY